MTPVTANLWIFEYEEAGHVLRKEWNAEETGVYFPLSTALWTEPAEEPIPEEARERVRDGFWKVAKKAGVRAILETLSTYSCWVAVRWMRDSGFLLCIFDNGEIVYMQRGKTLKLTFERRGEGRVAIVRRPPEPRWRFPEDVPVQDAEWQLIAQRLRDARDADIWLGRGWRITVEA